MAQEGDLIQLVSPSNKTTLVRLKSGDSVQSHRGVLAHDDLIGLPWGSKVHTHTGSYYFLLQPSLHDILKETRRNTQIMYPKDIGYILVMMGIGPGSRVVEAGTGSGALAVALAWAVGAGGQVISYEMRQEMQSLARKNLERVGLLGRVTLKLRDIEEGFDETGMEALFLDLPNPYDYLEQAYRLLRHGGHFGTILPTTNQVARLLSAFRQQPFGFIEVCEIMLRFYKPVADRLRPTDRMVAHTGYLVFARAMQLTAGEVLNTAEVDEDSSINSADSDTSNLAADAS
ncbi:MAG: tRNA (adenine-N1)-methyltransferase [Chloroflexi bacterium RBG_16_54_18]|nr:MAG: tRNA (adenine-N1)-methyltransferase [Chloroflexi bacterium RBG_16_54_18]